MKLIRGLTLGSVAAIVVTAGAQAADLPVKAKAVEYVKVCSLYGAGFYYIPGTDTCIRLGGYMRIDTSFNAAGPYEQPAWNGNSGQQNRLRNAFIGRVRQTLDIDTRTATEYGVLRTFFNGTFSWSTGTDGISTGSLGTNFAFIQFAGFTIGKAISQFDVPWTAYPGNNTSFLLGGESTETGIQQLAYTADFGQGVTGAVAVEDTATYRQSSLYNTSTMTPANYAQGLFGASSYGGTYAPDIVGMLRVDQAWGLFQASVAAHRVHASYYVPTLETSGHPSDAWGWAGQLGLSIKNLPTGPGDSINASVGYAYGASRYMYGSDAPGAFSMYGGTSLPGSYQSLASGGLADGVFGGTSSANGTSIQRSTAWGLRAGYNHNWNEKWSSSLFGSYSQMLWGAGGKALICTTAVGYACNPDFSLSQVGTVTRWTPVKGFTLSGEVMYTYLDQKNSGVVTLPTIATKPAAQYEWKDQGTLSVNVRAQRNF